MKKRLFILVEGEDDIRFFGRIIKPLLAPSYHSVEIVPYACIKREKVNKFLKSVTLMKNDYIFVADIDQERSVRDKKQILYYRFSDISGRSIVVVIREIESWYLAGLSFDSAQELGVPDLLETNQLTKEDFNTLIPHSSIPGSISCSRSSSPSQSRLRLTKTTRSGSLSPVTLPGSYPLTRPAAGNCPCRSGMHHRNDY